MVTWGYVKKYTAVRPSDISSVDKLASYSKLNPNFMPVWSSWTSKALRDRTDEQEYIYFERQPMAKKGDNSDDQMPHADDQGRRRKDGGGGGGGGVGRGRESFGKDFWSNMPSGFTGGGGGGGGGFSAVEGGLNLEPYVPMAEYGDHCRTFFMDRPFVMPPGGWMLTGWCDDIINNLLAPLPKGKSVLMQVVRWSASPNLRPIHCVTTASLPPPPRRIKQWAQPSYDEEGIQMVEGFRDGWCWPLSVQ